MPPERKREGVFSRILRRLGVTRRRVDRLGGVDEPPLTGVREPRRPRPPAPGGAVALEPPPTDEA